MRVYRPLNPGNINAHPAQSTRARVTFAEDVRGWLGRTGQKPGPDGTVTATFIVDTSACLWIADRHSERVACADGREVLAAGEITFDVTEPLLAASETSNQSLGYCPEPVCWPTVASALERAGIGHPGRFTAEFVFRKCTACGQSNIVKDEWYRCAVCDAPLSMLWNFQSDRTDSRRLGCSASAAEELDELIEEIITDAYNEEEQLWAFLQDFEDQITLPIEAIVIGQEVSAILFDYDGDNRRGISAKIRRKDGAEHVVAASEVVFPRGSIGARHIAAYRKWLGLEPRIEEETAGQR